MVYTLMNGVGFLMCAFGAVGVALAVFTDKLGAKGGWASGAAIGLGMFLMVGSWVAGIASQWDEAMAEQEERRLAYEAEKLEIEREGPAWIAACKQAADEAFAASPCPPRELEWRECELSVSRENTTPAKGRRVAWKLCLKDQASMDAQAWYTAGWESEGCAAEDAPRRPGEVSGILKDAAMSEGAQRCRERGY